MHTAKMIQRFSTAGIGVYYEKRRLTNPRKNRIIGETENPRGPKSGACGSMLKRADCIT